MNGVKHRLGLSLGVLGAFYLVNGFVCHGAYRRANEKRAEYDHGDSATRAKYGNYTFGRNVGDGRDLQVSPLKAEKRALREQFGFTRSARTHVPLSTRPRGAAG